MSKLLCGGGSGSDDDGRGNNLLQTIFWNRCYYL